VLVLIREIPPNASAAAPFHDRELDVREITFGSAPDRSLQILGPGVEGRHGTLTPSGSSLKLRCARGLTVQMGGKAVRRATLAIGDTVELAGTTLQVLDPPAGFAAALAVTPARDVAAADFEAAYHTALDQTWLSRRKPAWILAIAVVVIGLAIPWLAPRDSVPAWTSDQTWSTGPLHAAHSLAVGTDCHACHEVPFQRVQDSTCLNCHRGLADHAPPPLASHVGLDATRCATCHKEHNEPVHLTISADALCTDCHKAPAWPDNRLAQVGGFGPTSHPPFSVSLLVAETQPMGTGLGYRWHVASSALADAVDESNLKFPHDVHLDPARVQDQTSGEGLGCASCHQLMADNEHFAPISMERHCRACHDLKFDRRAPDRELPHGHPAEALLTMEGHYMRLFADPDVAEPTTARRRLPDRGGDSQRCDGPAYLCARESTAREAETQFTRRGCVTCHEVVVHDTRDLLARYQVVPVRLTRDFYPNAQFNHRVHLTRSDDGADAACLSCHQASTSSASSDVLMPGIDACVTCHGDHRTRTLVPLHCIDCHQFHPRKLGGGAE
jgi:predicted CXXCH cytochrome family protein